MASPPNQFGKRPKQDRVGTTHVKRSKRAKDVVKVGRRLGARYGRRATTDPFTTHVAMEEFITLRHGLLKGQLSLKMPKPDFAPRVFPGARTLIGEPEKRLGLEP